MPFDGADRVGDRCGAEHERVGGAGGEVDAAACSAPKLAPIDVGVASETVIALVCPE